jgi:hypothetical protein
MGKPAGIGVVSRDRAFVVDAIGEGPVIGIRYIESCDETALVPKVALVHELGVRIVFRDLTVIVDTICEGPTPGTSLAPGASNVVMRPCLSRTKP